VEGERYKKSPELVREAMKSLRKSKAAKKFIVFKRWDQLEDSDEPEVVIFFATPDVLAGLYTLANFDEFKGGVVAPFSSGYSSIVMYHYLERNNERPRCVFGMFDLSVRAYVPSDVITIAAPMNKFTRMIENMQESFLVTRTWDKIRNRISTGTPLRANK